MELTSNLIINNINNYFNGVLKNHLNYSEIYSISFDEDKQRITLTSDISDAKLPTLLQGKNNKWRIKIEQALLRGFKNIDNDFQNVNIYTVKQNEVLITYIYGENPMTFSEIGILSKLAAEYATENIDRICIINKNFAAACREELFWWEILRNKYPEYYKSKSKLIYKNHNALEVLKGMDQYVIRVVPELKDIQAYVEYNDRSANLKILIKNYLETFRYLILEGFWKLNVVDINWMLNSGIINDIDITKLLINELVKLNKFISIGLLENVYLGYINNGQLGLLKELDNFLISINIILPPQFYQNLLNAHRASNIKVDLNSYRWLTERPNVQMTSDDYLRHFGHISQNNVDVWKYILSKINPDFLQGNIIETLTVMAESEWHNKNLLFNKFAEFYSKVSYKLDEKDKRYLLNVIDASNRPDYSKQKYKDLIIKGR